MSVRQQRIDVLSEWKHSRPLLHFLQMVEGNLKGISILYIKRNHIHPTSNNSTSRCTSQLTHCIRILVHIFLDVSCSVVNGKREIILHLLHRSTEVLSMSSLVSSLTFRKVFILQPLTHSLHSWVKIFLYCSHIFLCDTHSTEFHFSISLLIDQIDIEHLTLFQMDGSLTSLLVGVVSNLNVHFLHTLTINTYKIHKLILAE